MVATARLPAGEPATTNKEKAGMANIDKEKLWRKIAKFAEKAGAKVIYNVLILYYTLLEPETPAKAKAIIIATLAYFISPLDAAPDVLPGGLLDDAAAIIGALAVIAVYVTEEIKAKARKQLKVWFGGDAIKQLDRGEE